MQVTKATGPRAGVLKYDLLTALGAHALSLGKQDQRSALRLMTLVTARYNWTRDELCVGQRDIARMWSCDERTVKREMARLRAAGWLILSRQGARGRVAQYRLDLDKIFADTRAARDNVGPDFTLRREIDETPDIPAKVVAFPGRTTAPPDIASGNEWALTQSVLHQERPELYGAWIAQITRVSREGGRLVLRAPSRFHASYVATHLLDEITAVCRSIDEGVSHIDLIV